MTRRTAARVLTASVLAAALLLTVPATAAAHAALEEATPAAGENLDAPPDEVVLTFDREVTDDSTFAVSGPEGEAVGTGELDLDVAERNVLRGAVDITEPGRYTVAWTATDALDGDTTTGELTFGFQADEEEPTESGGDDGEGGAPNTAAGPRSSSPLTPVGVMLVAVGALGALRRLALRA